MMLSIGRQKQTQNKAFTFIELVLVVAIVSILAGIYSISFRNSTRGIRLNQATQNMVQLMRYAQAKAIAERKLCRINFDFERNAFWLTEQEGDQPGNFKQPKTRWGKTYQLQDDIVIDLDQQPEFINFYPDGSTDRINIELSQGQESFVITVQRKISYAQVEE